MGTVALTPIEKAVPSHSCEMNSTRTDFCQAVAFDRILL